MIKWIFSFARITTSCKGKYYTSIHFKLFKIFIPVSSTSSGKKLVLPGSHHSFSFHFPWKEHVNSNKVFIFSTFLAVVSLVLRITASCKGKYSLNHAFQTFFQFCPVSSTSGGRNLFLPGRFKPGFNPVSSTRWKKPANPALEDGKMQL